MSVERREKIKELIKNRSGAISATALANIFDVSRQVIVGDIALLRAAGEAVFATPKGYIYNAVVEEFGYIGLVACKHDLSQLKDELYTIADLGGTVVDVTIDHSLYGQLSGLLNISSRHDADVFSDKVNGNHDKPLSMLTDGIHLHKIRCKDEATFLLIKEGLDKKNILYISN